jgi:hypothetical protein
MGQIWKAHQALHETINFVETYLLGGSNFGGVPRPIDDQLKYLDRPLVASDKMDTLYDKWRKFEKDVHSWEAWNPKKLISEIAKAGKPKR